MSKIVDPLLHCTALSLAAAGLRKKPLKKFDAIPKSNQGPNRHHFANDSCANKSLKGSGNY
jgi:hypothetical protein